MLSKTEIISEIWQKGLNGSITSQELQCLLDILVDLDLGKIRAAYKNEHGMWIVSIWVKQAIILMFRYFNAELLVCGDKFLSFYDKFLPKTLGWDDFDFKKSKFRLAIGADVRKGVYIGPNVIILPSFINVGAYIAEGTMIDSDVTIGSCAQIGKNCHISTGVKIGGVLEPVNESPVIIEDNVFIGAGSQIVEGVIVGEGSILGMGVMIGSSTRIINRDTNEVCFGYVPKDSVVVAGSYESKFGINIVCAVIIRSVDEKTKNKFSLSDFLRDEN